MNLLKAMNRLTYTVSNGHKCNDADVDALNFVIDWINKEKEDRLNKNHHFAKLAMFVYNEFLVHYKGDNKICEKEIQQILKSPLEHFYSVFKSHMDHYSMEIFFESIGTKPAWFQEGIKVQDIIDNSKYNNELFKDKEIQQLAVEHFKTNMYSDQEVHEKLNHFLSEILHGYEDKDHDLHFLTKYSNK